MFFFFFFSTSYIAIVGDIVGSKVLVDRNSAQRKLKSILDEVNTKYYDDIEAQFTITLGDEFQGLLRSGQQVMDIITEIEIQMHPIEVRFGIGVGDISTDINRYAALGADGEAYYRAREMIEEIRQLAQQKKPIPTDIMIKTDPQNEEIDRLINTIFTLCKSIKDRWTDRQKEVVYDCLQNGDNQEQVALRLGKQQPAIHKNLTAANYYSYKEAISVVSTMISTIRHSEEKAN